MSKRVKAAPVPKAPKERVPKSNVLGPLGRTEMPVSSRQPNSVVGEFAREADNTASKYVPPKKAK
jgi:hypothetical protein